jgi:NADH-quinone oxidoreductase subunit C
MDAAALAETLRRAVPAAAIAVAPSIDMPSLTVDREHIVDVCRVLRDDPALQYAFLSDVIGVDLLPEEPRFEVVYHLACLGEAYRKTAATVASDRWAAETTPGVVAAPPARLRLKVRVPGADPSVPTVSGVYPTAGWPEREVFDLMGITFDQHPDLRRILMPEDWEGYPLRRDYPVQIRKDAQVWSPVQLTVEEFAANVKAARDQARRQADGT